jgi:condensin complex subunit 3
MKTSNRRNKKNRFNTKIDSPEIETVDQSDSHNLNDGDDSVSSGEEDEDRILFKTKIGENEEGDDTDGDNDDEDDEDDDEEDDADEQDEDEDEAEAEEGEDDEEDIDIAISKADSRKKKISTIMQRRHYLSNLVNITTFEQLQLEIRKSFQEVQTTIAAHKRQLVIFKTLIDRAIKLHFESHFNTFFCHLLLKVLPIKKNIKAADKVVKFVSSLFESVNPTNINKAGDNDKTQHEMEEYEDFYSKFVEQVLKFLIKGLDSANNTVRYRVCQLLSHIISNCGGMDEDLYELISDELSTRIYDKDASVRMKAVTALSCFQNDDGTSLSLSGKRLRFIMQNDLNSEVRRACMKNIEKNRFTEPFIIERARDIDTINRRILFSKVLPSYNKFTDISSANRNKLLEWGLRDRDENVRKAASNWLTTTWMHDSNNDVVEFLDRLNVTENEIADTAVRVLVDKNPEIIDNLKLDKDFFENLTPSLALLLRVVYQYCQDNNKSDFIESMFLEAAEFASLFEKYFDLRTENFMKISNNREELERNPELANTLDIIDPDEYNYIIMQLLKIAVDYDYSDEYGRSKMYSILRSTLSNNTVAEPLLPLLMECLRKLAINERDFCQMTVEIINDLKDSEYERVMELKREEQKRKELAALEEASRNKRKRRHASSLDKDDEYEVDDEVAKINAKVKSLLQDNGDINSEDSDEEEYHSAMNDMSRQSIIEANKSRQEEIDQVSVLSPEILTDCLTITKCMLQLVFAPLKENMLLISLLDNFIVPCVNERSEVEVRELALTCHGLCGLLDKEVAVSTMVVAGIFVTRSDYESFVVTGLKVIGDLLTIHGISILQSDHQVSIDTMAVAKVFYRTLKDERKPEAQSVVAVTLFKLFLCGVIKDDELFETTLLTYFNPKVNKNQALKDCLTFCIPTYAFSRKDHQELIANIVYDTIDRLFKDWNEITRLNQELEVKQPITSNFIVESLLYWTDPYNLAMSSEEEMESSSVHLDVGIQFMKLLRNYDCNNKIHRTQYKAILRALSKLTFTSKADIIKLRKFRACFDDEQLCQGDIDEVLNSDVNCKNSFLKCHTYIQECLKEAEEAERERLEKEENFNRSLVKDEELEKAKFQENNETEKEDGAKATDLNNESENDSIIHSDMIVDDNEEQEKDKDIKELQRPDSKKDDISSGDSIDIIQEVSLDEKQKKKFTKKRKKVVQIKKEQDSSKRSLEYPIKQEKIEHQLHSKLSKTAKTSKISKTSKNSKSRALVGNVEEDRIHKPQHTRKNPKANNKKKNKPLSANNHVTEVEDLEILEDVGNSTSEVILLDSSDSE